MPIFDFKCRDCGRIGEVYLRNTSSEPDPCPDCGSVKWEKLPSAPGAILTAKSSPPGTTCCGRYERCEEPPCASGDDCRRK
jgi:putative FmdB family regulatory protein